MSNKQWYVAYVLDTFGSGKQLLKFLFQYEVIDFWAEPPEQRKLEKVFMERYKLSETEKLICIEASDTYVLS